MEYEFGACRPDELFELVELANRVFRSEATGRAGDMGAEYPLVFEAQNAEHLRVARAAGRIVSHVGLCLRDATLLGARVRIACVGAVATDPDHRGRGLATRLMEDARAHAVAHGASLMLISGHRGLYRRLGYVEVGAFLRTTVPATDPHGPEGEGVVVAEFQPEDLPALVHLYQAEPVRFFRPEEDWHRLLAASMLMNRPADLLVLRQGNAIVAYAGVQRPLPGEQVAAARVREIAGSRSALAAALPGIALACGFPAAEVVTWPSDAEWRTQAARRGWKGEPVPFPGRLGIIDAARFLRAVRPLLAERAGEALEIEPAEGGARLRAAGQSVAIPSMRALTALLFGGDTEDAALAPPLPEEVRAVCDRVFPLPLPWYGYNYI